jgi:hypothetical protein
MTRTEAKGATNWRQRQGNPPEAFPAQANVTTEDFPQRGLISRAQLEQSRLAAVSPVKTQQRVDNSQISHGGAIRHLKPWGWRGPGAASVR